MKAPKDTIKIKLDIRPGLVTPNQRVAWRRFWKKLIAEVRASER